MRKISGFTLRGLFSPIVLLVVSSVSFSFGWVLSRNSLTPTFIAQIPNERQSSKENQSSSKECSLSHLRILPHPPDFLETRTIHFDRLALVRKSGKLWVQFHEQNGRVWKNTDVDPSAIAWENP